MSPFQHHRLTPFNKWHLTDWKQFETWSNKRKKEKNIWMNWNIWDFQFITLSCTATYCSIPELFQNYWHPAKYRFLNIIWAVCEATILHCKAILSRGQHWEMMNLLWFMPMVQDRSLDLLTRSPAHYHGTTDAPTTILKQGPIPPSKPSK